MNYKKPIVDLIEEAAKAIVRNGKCSFTRMSITEKARIKMETGPVIQQWR
jgi:hypothetical protein